MRRWRVVVIDDNAEVSLEAVLLSPLVLPMPLPTDASRPDIPGLLAENPMSNYLGEPYAIAADVDFQIRTFAERRAECSPRFPMIEFERDFARAWRFIEEMAKDPPDILFLDVMFDQKTTLTAEMHVIVDELERSDRIGKIGDITILEVLGRGGLFLFGKLLKSRGQVQKMPLVVLYSASREVQSDFRPFEYASDGRFKVVEKKTLLQNPELRKQIFRQRVRDYLMDGTVRPDDIRAALDLLAEVRAIHGQDRQALVEAFCRPIGSGWTFGTMFPGESVAYLSSEPVRRLSVVEELDEFIAPLTNHARSFANLIAMSPARLFSHVGPVTFVRRPPWLDPELGALDDNGHIRIRLSDLNGQLSDVRSALESAVERLPTTLRKVLSDDLPRTDKAHGFGDRLDAFVGSLSKHDKVWEELLGRCRLHMPAYHIHESISQIAEGQALTVELLTPEILELSFDLRENLELLLAPSETPVKEPLATLLRAILGSMRRHADLSCGAPVQVSFSVLNEPATLEVTLRDSGGGFPDLRYYDPHGRGGDLSTALLTAAEWFEVEIHSGGVKRRPTSRGAGEIESSPVTTGTAFVIRIPAYRLEA